MTPDLMLLRNIGRYLCLCEQDSGNPEPEYDRIYIYSDGPGGIRQVTLARGYTQYGGNLWKVIERYISKGGAKAAFFRPCKARMGDAGLWKDKAFKIALRDAGAEKVMQDAQDEIFNEAYLGPGFRWCETNGFRQPLSFAVAADSFLHSGQMSPKLRARFTEAVPAKGGDEQAWIFAYLVERWKWFTRMSGDLHTCIFRPKFFLDLIAAYDGDEKKWTRIGSGRWEFTAPLVIPEKGRIC